MFLKIALAVCILFSFNVAAVGQNASSIRNAYASVNVTTGLAVQLVASMPYNTKSISVFDSSAQTMQLQIISGGRTDLVLIPPGGGDIPLKIPQGSVVSIIAISGNATTGELDINFLY